MILDSIANVKKYLIKAGIVHISDEPSVEYLSGGVSSRVWKIVLKSNRWVIKQAQEKLKVETDWFSDVERIHREHEVMNALNGIIPTDAIPRVLHIDYDNHIYMMECAEEEAQTWKDILMNGKFSISVAENAANLLREIHHHSIRIDTVDKAKFQDQKYFIQLRIDPFHRFLVQKYPELSSSIQLLINELTLQKTCLVHGDFSPKNMLIKKDENIVLIDFEVAHWGNPVFDVAYCLGHLLLKGYYHKQPFEVFKLIEMFLTAYGKEVNNLTPHIGLMLLARMDGKSPVNYIKDENMKNTIREVAISWIQNKNRDNNILHDIQNSFRINF